MATLERLYARLLTKGGKGGGPLSAKTVANVAGVLSIALADAVRLRLLPHNVATDARLPRRQRPEMTAWSEEQAAAFLDSVSGERLFPLWRLALATGMRRGELCGLRWRDVDLDSGDGDDRQHAGRRRCRGDRRAEDTSRLAGGGARPGDGRYALGVAAASGGGASRRRSGVD